VDAWRSVRRHRMSASFALRFADITGMQVSSIASSANASGGSSEIAQLQKQLKAAIQKLKDLATSSLNADAKQKMQQLLQAQIAALEQQIAAAQQKKQEQVQKAQAASQAEKNRVSPSSKARSGGSLGSQVDAFA
jgi:hypothetical protein